MSAIAASDLTYTLLNRRKDESSRKRFNVKIQFGDGALTYPSGGIPLSLGKLGCPNVIESLVVYDSGASGYHYEYDQANGKLRLFQSAQHTHDLLLKNAAVADSAGSRVNAGANLLGANTGGDLTVAGAGANGGVVNKAAVALSELGTSVAPAAQTIKVEVCGW